jgi:predicted nuclease with TOPRIM domain
VDEKVESEDSVGALRKKLESLEAEMKEVKERLNAITGA